MVITGTERLVLLGVPCEDWAGAQRSPHRQNAGAQRDHAEQQRQPDEGRRIGRGHGPELRFQLVTVNKEDEAVLQQAMAGALKAALSSAVQNGALKKLMEAREKKRKGGGS